EPPRRFGLDHVRDPPRAGDDEVVARALVVGGLRGAGGLPGEEAAALFADGRFAMGVAEDLLEVVGDAAVAAVAEDLPCGGACRGPHPVGLPAAALEPPQ